MKSADDAGYLAILRKKKPTHKDDEPMNQLQKLKNKKLRYLQKNRPIPTNPRAKLPQTYAPAGPRTLSQAVAEFPHLCEPLKINLVDKFITEIDAIPQKYLQAETLYLSNNSISGVKLLSQFPKLKVLSIANNCITDIDELGFVASGSGNTLTALNMENNPVSSIPNYRYHVLAKFPQLKVLDNKDVTLEERKFAEVAIRKEATVLDLMYSNECLIHRLEMGVQKMQLHNELRAGGIGRTNLLRRAINMDSFLSSTFDVKKFLKYLDLEQDDLNSAKKTIYNELRKRVRMAYNTRAHKSRNDSAKTKPKNKPNLKRPFSSGDLWDMAFSEVMLHQQNMIAKLLTQVEDAKKVSDGLNEEFQSIDPRGRLNRLRDHQAEVQRASKLEREAIIGEFRQTIQRLLKDFRDDALQPENYESQIKTLQTDSIDNHDSPSYRFKKFQEKKAALSQHTESKISTHPEPADYSTKIPTSNRPPYVFHSTSTKQDVHEPISSMTHQQNHPYLEKNSRSPNKSSIPKEISKERTSGEFVGPKEDNLSFSMSKSPKASSTLKAREEEIAILAEQIAILRDELIKRDHKQEHLLDLNKQLQERLRLFQQQNEENVKNYETEVMLLHEKTIESKKSLQDQLQEAAKQKKQLEKELEKVALLENTEELIKRKRESRLLKRSLEFWRRAVVFKKEEAIQLETAAIELNERNLLKKGFDRWKEKYLQNKKETHSKKLLADQHLKAKYFRKWRIQVAKLQDRYKQRQLAVEKFTHRLKMHTFIHWAAVYRHSKMKKQHQMEMEHHHALKVQQLESEIVELKSRLNHNEKEAAILKSESREQQETISTLKEASKGYKEILHKLSIATEVTASLRKILDEKDAQLAAKDALLRQYKAQLDRAHATIDELTAQLEESRNTVEDFVHQITKLTQEIKVLNTKDDNVDMLSDHRHTRTAHVRRDSEGYPVDFFRIFNLFFDLHKLYKPYEPSGISLSSPNAEPLQDYLDSKGKHPSTQKDELAQLYEEIESLQAKIFSRLNSPDSKGKHGM